MEKLTITIVLEDTASRKNMLAVSSGYLLKLAELLLGAAMTNTENSIWKLTEPHEYYDGQTRMTVTYKS